MSFLKSPPPSVLSASLITVFPERPSGLTLRALSPSSPLPLKPAPSLHWLPSSSLNHCLPGASFVAPTYVTSAPLPVRPLPLPGAPPSPGISPLSSSSATFPELLSHSPVALQPLPHPLSVCLSVDRSLTFPPSPMSVCVILSVIPSQPVLLLSRLPSVLTAPTPSLGGR